MNESPLFTALAYLDDRHIREAAAPGLRRRPVRVLRRAAVIAAAAVLALALALPALASSDATYPLLYAAAPGLAQYFKPVRLSCEDNGIEMEVISACVHGDTAEAYIALRDLTGDRVDETIDLFDSYDFHIPFDSIGTCRLEGWDPGTRTATFYVLFSSMDGQDLRPQEGKVTFSLQKFLSHKQTVEGVDLSDALSPLPAEPETRTDMPIRGSSGSDVLGGSAACLVPQSQPLLTPAEGVAVTGAGYVDGKLHIQVRYEDILRTDNHGSLYAVDENGAILECAASVSFWDEDGVSSYEDYVFDIPETSLENVAFFGDFCTGGRLTEGSWQVTFPLEAE